MGEVIYKKQAIEAIKAHYPKPNEMIAGLVCVLPIDAVEVVRCKNCKHYPTNANSKPKSGYDIEWPKETDGWEDRTCPCYCPDPYYSYVPDPNGFCNEGETKE